MEAFRHTMRTHLGAVPDENRWRAGFGRPLRPQLANFAHDAGQASRMVDTYRDFTDEHHDRLLRPFPGIDEALTALRAAAPGWGSSPARRTGWRGAGWPAAGWTAASTR